MKALSIRQPWAGLIVAGHKDIENRDWYTNYRGTVLIHAAQKYDKQGSVIAEQILRSLGIKELPEICHQLGGIVGMAVINGCVRESDSPWFFGKHGFTLAGARPLAFRPYKGQLSFFETGLAPLGDRLVSIPPTPEELRGAKS
ncbi:ASCH domain-containing/PUA-like superfamily protein [Serratia phage Parlo]|uniref:ASCH domain-containing/PUA-like superfamily protein n=1 Tax=Serratia phage Parlo TaxID=2557554 RepID=A0A482MI06_9CAUD|nr:ASCH domain-containing/PUA-like superfamily protein [Serratia phage Parlo]QBQ72177.1 ASCH domain-containing/PUA-like superfamily protein [Serratia phage Parlo]